MYSVASPLLSLLILHPLLTSRALAIICGPGKFATAKGCQKCPYGTYKSDLSAASSCTACPGTSYTAARGVVTSKLCFECPFTSKVSTDRSRCVPCRNGLAGSCTQCVRCPPGTFVSRKNPCGCQKCELNYISRNWNTRRCTRCPEGMVGGDARTRCVHPKCKPGYANEVEHFGFVLCEECYEGYYSNASAPACTKCPFGTVGNKKLASTACIPCPPGSYAADWMPQTISSNPVCVKCPAGSTTYGWGNTLCRKKGAACPPNSLENSEGDCKSCGFNHRMNYTTMTCVPCEKDSIAPQGVSEKCTKCPPRSKALDFTDDCLCEKGYMYSDGKCEPCDKGTAARWYEYTCETCLAGSIAPVEGMKKCTECPEGTWTVGKNREKCEPVPECDPGYMYLDYPYVGGGYFKIYRPQVERQCLSVTTGCPPGLELAIRNNTLMCVYADGSIYCPPGSALNNKRRCLSCPVDKFLKKNPKTGALECESCPSGKMSPGADSKSCKGCSKGFFHGPIDCYCGTGRYIRKSDGECVKCEKGYVNKDVNQSECVKCPDGFTSGYGAYECECWWPRFIDRFGNCVKDKSGIDYP